MHALPNPDKQPFDDDEMIIVIQPWDALKEILIPLLKTFYFSSFWLSSRHLHISCVAVRKKAFKRNKKQKRILEGLAEQVDQMINHTDRAKKIEWNEDVAACLRAQVFLFLMLIISV